MNLLFLFFTSLAFATDLNCPQYIETKQSMVGKAEGFQASDSESKSIVESISVYDGHPKENTSLVPTNDKPEWHFNEKKERPIWMSCHYYFTRVTLVKELPKNVKKCSLKRSDKSFVPFLSCE